MSLVQLVVGDALLPRFVVFGAALLLPDWYRICVGIANGGRARAEARDRVVFVGPTPSEAALDDELGRAPERPASVLARLGPAEAAVDGPCSGWPTALRRRSSCSIGGPGR